MRGLALVLLVLVGALAQTHEERVEAFQECLASAPEELVDPVTSELMMEPVVVTTPTSTQLYDFATLLRHFDSAWKMHRALGYAPHLFKRTDIMTRAELTMDDILRKGSVFKKVMSHIKSCNYPVEEPQYELSPYLADFLTMEDVKDPVELVGGYIPNTHVQSNPFMSLSTAKMLFGSDRPFKKLDWLSRMIAAATANLEIAKSKWGSISKSPFPMELRCPLTLEPLLEPVIAHTGETFQYQNLQAWVNNLQMLPYETGSGESVVGHSMHELTFEGDRAIRGDASTQRTVRNRINRFLRLHPPSYSIALDQGVNLNLAMEFPFFLCSFSGRLMRDPAIYTPHLNSEALGLSRKSFLVDRESIAALGKFGRDLPLSDIPGKGQQDLAKSAIRNEILFTTHPVLKHVDRKYRCPISRGLIFDPVDIDQGDVDDGTWYLYSRSSVQIYMEGFPYNPLTHERFDKERFFRPDMAAYNHDFDRHMRSVIRDKWMPQREFLKRDLSPSKIDEFLCPITRTVMLDPVYIPSTPRRIVELSMLNIFCDSMNRCSLPGIGDFRRKPVSDTKLQKRITKYVLKKLLGMLAERPPLLPEGYVLRDGFSTERYTCSLSKQLMTDPVKVDTGGARFEYFDRFSLELFCDYTDCVVPDRESGRFRRFPVDRIQPAEQLKHDLDRLLSNPRALRRTLSAYFCRKPIRTHPTDTIA